jgi:hypothetical protein
LSQAFVNAAAITKKAIVIKTYIISAIMFILEPTKNADYIDRIYMQGDKWKENRMAGRI